MFGLSSLKPVLAIAEDMTSCPVRGCKTRVPRQQKHFLRTPAIFCKTHHIYISRSTFEYDDKYSNLLWTNPADRALLDAISGTKRENRMARDNSEDAVTWNIFRFLETHDLLEAWLTSMVASTIVHPRLIYWAYSSDSQSTWGTLTEARKAFQELDRGSEPDLIVLSDSALFFIEAKLTSSNKTTPSDPARRKRYESGGDAWYRSVVTSDFNHVAIEKKRYELLRLWLLGSWAAATKLKKTFYLVNLVRKEREEDIVQSLSPHLRVTPGRQFLRTTWEAIYDLVNNSATRSPDGTKLLRYMEEKTIGYDGRGHIKKAFSL